MTLLSGIEVSQASVSVKLAIAVNRMTGKWITEMDDHLNKIWTMYLSRPDPIFEHAESSALDEYQILHRFYL